MKIHLSKPGGLSRHVHIGSGGEAMVVVVEVVGSVRDGTGRLRSMKTDAACGTAPPDSRNFALGGQ
ncbi:hypothetical protein ACFL6C_05615 [Myxococcota bacterium]